MDESLCGCRGEGVRTSFWLQGLRAALCGQHERPGAEGPRTARHPLNVDAAPGTISNTPHSVEAQTKFKQHQGQKPFSTTFSTVLHLGDLKSILFEFRWRFASHFVDSFHVCSALNKSLPPVSKLLGSATDMRVFCSFIVKELKAF